MKTLHAYLVKVTIIFVVLFTAGFYSGNNPDVAPCEILTQKQVQTVLPGAGEGYTAMSGGSLMEGVDSYQCSYANDKMDILTVIYHVAADEENFSWIKPRGSSLNTAVKVGDGGWISSEDDKLRLEASKGLKVIELNLMAPNAKGKTDAMIKLAKIMIDKI